MIFYEKLDSISFTVPAVCAHCGEREGHYPWKIHSAYGGVFLFVYTSHKSLTFNVLVCEDCKTKLERLQKLWHVAFMVCGLSIPASLFVMVLYPPLAVAAFWVFILGLPLSFVVMWRRGYYSQGKNLGKYTGKRFKFKNPEFDRQFAAVNAEGAQTQEM